MKNAQRKVGEHLHEVRGELTLSRPVLKAKVISGLDFEKKLNDFIKDRTIVDIKYSCCIGQSSYIFDRALVIYKEVE